MPFRCGGCGTVAALGAAVRPQCFAQIGGGLWEVSGVPDGGRRNICVADPIVLAQYEHRGSALQPRRDPGPATAGR